MRRSLPLAVPALALALLTPACKGDATGAQRGGSAAATAEPTYQAEIQHVRTGWIGAIAKDHNRFNDLAKTSAGWPELYRGQIARAMRTFAKSIEELEEEDAATRARLSIGLGRTLLAVGELYRTNSELSVRLLRHYFDERARRRTKGTAVKPSERLYHGIALVRGGEAEKGLETLAAVAAGGPEAGPWAAQAEAWRGYALHSLGKAEQAKKAWATADAGGEEAKDLATYLRLRSGVPGEAKLAGGSPMRERLRISAAARRGDHQQVDRSLSALDHRTPDQTDTIPALAGDNAAGEAELRYFSTVLLDDVARLHLSRAAATLTGIGGCADYWMGRVREALGDKDKAAEAYGRVAAGAGNPDPNSLACLLFSSHQELADLAADAGFRADALAGEKAPIEASDERLLRRAWRIGAALKARFAGDVSSKEVLAVLQGVPDDPDPITTAIDTALAESSSEDGGKVVANLRLTEAYAARVLRAKAVIAAAVGEPPAALALLEATHDNQNSDEISSINDPIYLMATGIVNWDLKRARRAIQQLDTLTERYPALWQNIEFMKRIDAIAAVGDVSTPVMGN